MTAEEHTPSSAIERRKAYQKAYYASARIRARRKIQRKRLLAVNGDKIRDKAKEWRARNKEKLYAYNKKYLENPEAKERAKLRMKMWAKMNRDRILANAQKRQGMPVPTRPRPKSCELCGKINGTGRLHLDHCHDSGKFRGWLCYKCNIGIGYFNDSPEQLEKAVEYLRKAQMVGI